MKSASITTLVACLVARPLMPAQSTAPLPQFQASSHVVSLWVSVRGSDGEPVTDLRREDFVLLEEGRNFAIEHFGRQGEAGDDSLYSLNLGLLFDVSASMLPAIKGSRASALAFLDNLPNAQALTVTLFDHVARLAQYTPDKKDVFRRWIEKESFGGGSAVYAGLAHAMDAMKASGKRRVLVVLTDGLDESSVISLDQLEQKLLQADAMVYVVQFRDGLESSGVPGARGIASAAMKKLTSSTGGVLVQGDRIDPAAVFHHIRTDIMSQYVLGYTARPGKSFRKVRVILRRPDMKVRHRRGYYPPGYIHR